MSLDKCHEEKEPLLWESLKDLLREALKLPTTDLIRVEIRTLMLLDFPWDKILGNPIEANGPTFLEALLVIADHDLVLLLLKRGFLTQKQMEDKDHHLLKWLLTYNRCARAAIVYTLVEEFEIDLRQADRDLSGCIVVAAREDEHSLLVHLRGRLPWYYRMLARDPWFLTGGFLLSAGVFLLMLFP